jgi:3-hydroxyacyl-CoA dehydrogenase
MVKGEGGGRTILSIDHETLEYTPQAKVRYESLGATRNIKDTRERLKAVISYDDRAAQLARKVTYGTLAYSARRLGEIADDLVNIDRGLRWGYGWELGPFEAWDAIGVADGLAGMTAAGIDVPAWVVEMVESGHGSFYSTDEGGNPTYYDPRTEGYVPVPRGRRDVSLALLKSTGGAKKVKSNLSASTWDLGDGVLGLELHSALNAKLNPIDDDIVWMMDFACDELESNFDGMVIYQDSENFSAGANLLLVFMQIQQGNWDALRGIVTSFQAANQRMRYSSKPVVAAPSGLALGGGCEVVLGANAIQAAAELYIGLVEVGMGLIPGGGGTLNLLKNLYGQFSTDRDFDPAPFIKKAFMTIGMAQVATSAEQAREMGFLRPTDGVSLNRDQLLYAARERVLGMARAGFTAPLPKAFRLPGPDGAATVDMLLYSMVQNHQISEHDRLIGRTLARVLTGGDTGLTSTVTEEHLLELEAEAFLSLCGEEKTQARIGHFLNTNKPLRN